MICLLLALVVVLVPQGSLSSSAVYDGVVEWLKPGEIIEFGAKEVPHHLLLNRLNWVEKNERSTSKNYTLWKDADLYLLEWPGNITLFDQDNPTVQWGRLRAKYIEDQCAKEHTGIEMRAYAYQYVYLTWGPYRLTKTYSPPLTVPRSVLPFQTFGKLSRNNNFEPNKLNAIVAYDIAFVYDALLIAHSCGIVRVSGLEMAWAEMGRNPKKSLEYSTSIGIAGTIDRLVVQSCCLKTQYCPFGNMVVAYKELSFPHLIHTSYDGGISFQRVSPIPLTSNVGILRVVFSYPELNSLLIVHGNNTLMKMSQIIHTPDTARLLEEKTLFNFQVRGVLQGSRLGMENSLVLWDNCSVWYYSNVESKATRSLFYVHKKISEAGTSKHRISSERCTFGIGSTIAYGMNGRFGLVDIHNVFYLGVDVKSNFSQLIALYVDMSLLHGGTEYSIYPHFDNVEQPRLLYPPKFLELPESLNMGKSYDRRLGMRLLLKGVYPSDYIHSFYEENAKIKSGTATTYVLQPCPTSSLKMNGSISQRRKYYSLGIRDNLNFTITFKSRSSSLRQLKFEPRRVLQYFIITARPASIDMVETEKPRYLIKYRVMIKPSTTATIGKVFRVNFFTKNALRCNPQPMVPMYIKVTDIQETKTFAKEFSDEDMAHATYLKSVDSTGGATYLNSKGVRLDETTKVDSCPLSKT